MGLRPSDRALLLVVFAALAAFATAVDGGFVNWDDQWLIVANPHLRGAEHLPTMLHPFTDRASLGSEYLPVRDVSALIDFSLFGLHPRAWRLGNLLLYALSAGLALALLREATGSLRVATVGALLWAVHPLHAEVVAWASARKDLLNAVFALSAAVLHLRGVRTGRPWPRRAAVGLFLLATLSKTSAAALPGFLFAWEIVRGDPERSLRERAGTALRHTAPLLVIAAAGAWLNAHHQAAGWVKAEWRAGGPVANLFVMGGVYVRYLQQVIWPAGLAPDYAIGAQDPYAALNIAGVLLVLATGAAAVILARRRIPAALGPLWWTLLLLPVSNLLVPITNASADRYLFLPSLGATALAGFAFEAARRRGGTAARAAPWVVGAATVALGIAAAQQARIWRGPVPLWSHAVAVSPQCGRAWQNHGEALALEGRREEALASFRRMVEVEPWNSDYWTHAGNRLYQLGGPQHADEVEDILRRAVETAEPGRGGPFVALAWLVNERGDPEEAVRLLEEAVRRQPTLSEAHYNLGRWHLAQGRVEEAIREYEAALEFGMPLVQEIEAHDELVDLYHRIGQGDKARPHREERERKRALARGDV